MKPATGKGMERARRFSLSEGGKEMDVTVVTVSDVRTRDEVVHVFSEQARTELAFQTHDIAEPL